MRQIEYEFRAKRNGASGRAFEPDGDAATISGANAGDDTRCSARAGANAGAGSGRKSGEYASAAAGTARAISGAGGTNVAGDSGEVAFALMTAAALLLYALAVVLMNRGTGIRE